MQPMDRTHRPQRTHPMLPTHLMHSTHPRHHHQRGQTRTRDRGLRALLVITSLLLLPLRTPAQEPWPTKPVRLIAPFAPGGSTDVAARMVATQLSQTLGQQFVVDNRAGAGGIIGMEAAAKAAPDGYTLVIGSLSTTVLAAARSVPLPFDPARDLRPVAMIVSIPLMIAATPGMNATSFSEFANLLKSKPGTYTLASAGQGTSGHIIGEYLAATLKTKIAAAHYRGAAPVLPDLIAGRTHFTVNPPALLGEYVANGRLTGVVILSKNRSKLVPNVPTLNEVNLTGFVGHEWGSWNGLFAPAATPAAIVERLNRETNAVLTTPAINQRLTELGFEVLGDYTIATARDFIKAQFDHWLPVVKATGVKLD